MHLIICQKAVNYRLTCLCDNDKIKIVEDRRRTQNMTNNYVNKLCYISSTIVQNKVLNGSVYYLLTNLKVENFLHEING